MLGPLMLALCDADAQVFQRTSSTMARNGMDHFMIQFYEFGEQYVDVGGRQIRHDTSSMLVYDLAREFSGVAERFANLSLIIPRELVTQNVRCPNDQHLRHFTTRDPLVSILHDYLQSAFRNATNLSMPEAADVGRVALELSVACLNAGGKPHEGAARANRMATMIAARQLIERNLSNPDLSPDWIAGQIGVSRATLYRMFEHLGGIVIFIRDMRLRRAYRQLQDPVAAHCSILNIALNAGYGSDTAFGRAFKNRYGLTPRDVRNGVCSLDDMQTGNSSTPDRRYETWLTTMSA